MKREQFESTGIYIERGLFSQAECDALSDHMMELRKSPQAGDFDGMDSASNDPLKKFPRMIHMHRWDERSMDWAVDSRLQNVMNELLGEDPMLVQTMLYFKPAGARGQALHQDQTYLRAQPGTCIAAWLALDDCDEENGCMQYVPGTQNLPILCTVKADTTQSFTDVTVPLLAGMVPEPIVMKRGDCLFFNGSVIHGSFPNTSPDRFRRALIGHYLTGNAEKVGGFYHPVYRFDRSIVELGLSPESTMCGTWVDEPATSEEGTVQSGLVDQIKMINAADHDRKVIHE